ncbi:WD40-repeat-containing domain protein, partial [Jimgerdemannia flammicorona]
MQLISHLKGHKASILCLETAQNAPLGGAVLASGSEDRTCRIWDLRTEKAAKAIRGLENEVTSIHMLPYKTEQPPSLPGRRQKGPRVRPSKSGPNPLAINTQDELNQITINDKDKYLATADDNGQVKVVDLETHQLYKQFRTKHDNICMAVRFRPKKPWDLFSGGMDNNLIQWDFSRGVPTVVWDMAAPSDLTPGAQVFNPPFVYTIAASDDGHVMGVGLGDGSIKVLTTAASGAGKGPGKKGGKGWTEWRLDSGHGCAVVKLFHPHPDQSSSLRLHRCDRMSMGPLS